MINKKRTSLSIILIALFAGQSFLPVLAADTSPTGYPGGTNVQGGPSQAEIDALIKQGQESAQQQQAQNQGSQNQSGPMGGQQSGNQSPANFSMPNLPAMPQMPAGGPTPEFMGQPLAGGGASQAAGPIGAGLEQLRDGLVQMEDGLKEMKAGKVDISSVEDAVKSARENYEKAKNAFAAGDYQGAGTYLGQVQSLGLEAKFAVVEAKAITPTLISDVRKQLKQAQSQLDKVKQDDSDLTDTKAKIASALIQVDSADQLLKAGKTKEAALVMKTLRDLSPEGDASALAGDYKGMPKSKMKEVLNKIEEGLVRSDEGLKKSEAHGITDTSKERTLLEKAKAAYDAANEAFDKEDYTTAGAKISEISDMDLQTEFMAFKNRTLTTDRLQLWYDELKNGVKALEITIAHAKEDTYDTTEPDALLTKLKALSDQAGAALAAKDTNAFLTYMDQAAALQTNETVNIILRKIAEQRAGEMVKPGLDQATKAIAMIKKMVAGLDAKVVDKTNINNLLANVDADYVSTQSNYDKGNYMDAGRVLDDVVSNLINIKDLLTDSGAKMTSDANQAITDLSKLGASANGMNVSVDKTNRMTNFLSIIQPGDKMDMQSSLSSFDPALLDKVISRREKDKKFIDSIITDVAPLIPAADREEMLNGKINLLQEADSADKTIATIKKLKGVGADTVKSMSDIKDQIKSYNFPAEIAGKLQEKIGNFNDQVQSGDLKSVADIKSYVDVLKTEVTKNMQAAATEKFKDGLIPAKNVDDNNPSFKDIAYLSQDGAVKADKKGEINLSQKLNSKQVGEMINNTIDKKVADTKSTAAITNKDVLKKVADSYKVKSGVDFNNPAKAAEFAKKIGVNISAADLKKPATMDKTASIIAKADQRWGSK